MRAARIIVHHTAGHHREITPPVTDSLEEAKAYAKAIQAFHMDVNGWIDSGHNFLVTRAGHVLQGRWGTVTQIQAGRMVVSAHCPGQNSQVGVEHEHQGVEEMTGAQLEASAWLIAWISVQYKLKAALPLFPHSQFTATACPANLAADLPALAVEANRLLKARSV